MPSDDMFADFTPTYYQLLNERHREKEIEDKYQEFKQKRKQKAAKRGRDWKVWAPIILPLGILFGLLVMYLIFLPQAAADTKCFVSSSHEINKAIEAASVPNYVEVDGAC